MDKPNARLLAALDAFEKTLRRSASLATNDFDGRRKEAIELRRDIAAHRSTISSLYEQDLGGKAIQPEFRSRFSKLCAAIALHQASWPVTAIDLGCSEYSASINTVRAAYALFFEWARRALIED